MLTYAVIWRKHLSMDLAALFGVIFTLVVFPPLGVPLLLLFATTLDIGKRDTVSFTLPPNRSASVPLKKYQYEPWEPKVPNDDRIRFKIFLENEIMSPQERREYLTSPAHFDMSVILWYRLRHNLTSAQMWHFCKTRVRPAGLLQ